MFLVIETILPIDVDLGVFEKTRAQLFDYYTYFGRFVQALLVASLLSKLGGKETVTKELTALIVVVFVVRIGILP